MKETYEEDRLPKRHNKNNYQQKHPAISKFLMAGVDIICAKLVEAPKFDWLGLLKCQLLSFGALSMLWLTSLLLHLSFLVSIAVQAAACLGAASREIQDH
eukprot:3111542-Amphidinium_carterae.1